MAGAALSAAALITVPVTALTDDSELFLGLRQVEAASSNVLFLIDTSGSMGSLVATQAPWSASTTFDGCYDSDALYFSATGTVPACGSIDFIPKTANVCAASSMPLAQLGHYSDLVLAWDPARERWDEPSLSRPNEPLECESDRGIHGDGAGGGLYAGNGPDGPWLGTDSAEPAWNVQYTLYDGNWLNWNAAPPTVEKTRLEVVQEVVGKLVAGLDGVNVGIMQFNGSNGAAVVHPVSDVDDGREAAKTVIDSLHAAGATPLSEALYEAAQYLAGRTVDFGDADPIRSVAGARVDNDPAGALYRSPVADACSRNFIILLTDGAPEEDSDGETRIRNLPGFGTLIGADCDGTGQGRCLDDLAEYLRVADLNPDLPGPQNVVTHTIGFALDLPLLDATARRGGGEYRLADDTSTLSRALGGIVRSIGDSAASFSPPLVPVNEFNRTENLGDVYVAMFQPSTLTRWAGNLKKYRLTNGVLTGQTGRPAIDPVTGLFATDAFSFWSSLPDGGAVSQGGAASRLPDYRSRRLFSNLVGPELAGIGNRVHPDNGILTPARLGVPEDERQALIQWALGRDVRDADQDGDTTETRRAMGDSLHGQPVTVVYGGSAVSPTGTVFVATNEGFLHAFDTESGAERWAFVPSRLLNRLYPLYLDEPATTKHYGLDGQLALHILNDDGVPGISGAERAILVFGMGRGGNAVFALDVTVSNAPRVLWEVDSGTAGFADLGQTWSTPAVGRIRIGATAHTVALFGGGYDDGQDAGPYRIDTVGNAIYAVDLLTGALVWSAGHPDALAAHDLLLPEMRQSIPAGLRVIDIDGDGLDDRIYAGDMGGRLWRLDLINGEPRASFGAGGVLASLGGAAAGNDPPPQALRRFYETPDAVPVRIAGQLVIAVNLGSGYRGHPLDTTIDEVFFSIRDFDFFGVIPTDAYPPAVTVGDVVDITDDPAPALPASVAGWQLRLVQGAGEKVLGPATTADNVVLFSSFTPGETVNACTVGTGTGRLYAISVLDGSPLTNLDASVDEALTVLDRFVELAGGIPTTGPRTLETEDGPLVCVGPQCIDLPLARRPSTWRTYWFEDQLPAAP